LRRFAARLLGLMVGVKQDEIGEDVGAGFAHGRCDR
jgi:hypothetical protein